jgi:hypothetical protein
LLAGDAGKVIQAPLAAKLSLPRFAIFAEKAELRPMAQGLLALALAAKMEETERLDSKDAAAGAKIRPNASVWGFRAGINMLISSPARYSTRVIVS